MWKTNSSIELILIYFVKGTLTFKIRMGSLQYAGPESTWHGQV